MADDLLDIEQPGALVTYLRAAGRIEPNESPRTEILAGGVSSFSAGAGGGKQRLFDWLYSASFDGGTPNLHAVNNVGATVMSALLGSDAQSVSDWPGWELAVSVPLFLLCLLYLLMRPVVPAEPVSPVDVVHTPPADTVPPPF